MFQYSLILVVILSFVGVSIGCGDAKRQNPRQPRRVNAQRNGPTNSNGPGSPASRANSPNRTNSPNVQPSKELQEVADYVKQQEEQGTPILAENLSKGTFKLTSVTSAYELQNTGASQETRAAVTQTVAGTKSDDARLGQASFQKFANKSNGQIGITDLGREIHIPISFTLKAEQKGFAADNLEQDTKHFKTQLIITGQTGEMRQSFSNAGLAEVDSLLELLAKGQLHAQGHYVSNDQASKEITIALKAIGNTELKIVVRAREAATGDNRSPAISRLIILTYRLQAAN